MLEPDDMSQYTRFPTNMNLAYIYIHYTYIIFMFSIIVFCIVNITWLA